ncbi:TPA: N-acetyltransferase, partial [Clostridioides difficile]|nr:N-acetyltransferase [Clostridioides difficile]
VLTSYKGKPVIVGYFTLANKYFTIKRKTLSNSLARKIVKFGQYNEELRRYIIGAPLIGQIGKNYSNNYNKLIKGDELLKIACDKIKAVQLDMGGKIVYLECEDKPKLIEFYKDNG